MFKKTIILTVLSALLITTPISVKAAAVSEYSFVDVIGEVSETNYNRLMKNYCKIPENVREAYQLDGWRLSISTEHLEDTWFAGWGYSAIASGYDDSIKEIRVEDTKNGTNAVAHEIGHYVDGKLGYISNTDEWQDIWKQEITSKYGKISPLEGFAEAFEQTIYNPVTYKKKCPQSYQFILNCIGGISTDSSL